MTSAFVCCFNVVCCPLLVCLLREMRKRITNWFLNFYIDLITLFSIDVVIVVIVVFVFKGR